MRALFDPVGPLLGQGCLQILVGGILAVERGVQSVQQARERLAVALAGSG